jgi:hypothetical protein
LNQVSSAKITPDGGMLGGTDNMFFSQQNNYDRQQQLSQCLQARNMQGSGSNCFTNPV